MSEETDALIDGLLQRESSSGATLLWGGLTLPCSGGSPRLGKTLEIGGFRPNADVIVILRAAVIPDGTGQPTLKQTVVFVAQPNGSRRSLRVDSVTNIWDDILVLECNDPNQAA